MISTDLREINDRIRRAKTVRLFLDYDGTLADFAPNPGVILPDAQLIGLIARLVRSARFLSAIVSGRRLSDVRALLPIEGLILAGSYGLEMQLADGSVRAAVKPATVRPIIEGVLRRWEVLIHGRSGFFLEDKGLAAALHALHAAPGEALEVISAAKGAIEQAHPGPDFRLTEGDRFLEIAPALANKARAVQEIMSEHTPADALAVYAGDDEMDEQAFAEVGRLGGISVRVAAQSVPSRATCRLESPQAVRAWLDLLIEE